MEDNKPVSNNKYRLRYTTDFKHQICLKYLSGRYSKEELQRDYGIKGKSRLLTWLRQLGYIGKNNIQTMNAPKLTKPQVGTDAAKYTKALEQALEDAQLQTAIYHKMIEIAERDYKIEIIKNFSTK